MTNLYERAGRNVVEPCEHKHNESYCLNTGWSHLVTTKEGSKWLCETCIDMCFNQEQQFVIDGHTDLITCHCGNTPFDDGFGTCTPTGVWCEDPTGRTKDLPWDGYHHRCAKCNFVFSIDPEIGWDE